MYGKLKMKAKFAAAHHIPTHDGKCRNAHGHTWRVDLEFEGKVNEATGFVVDFSHARKVINAALPDHTDLNVTFPDIPMTAETLVKILAKAVEGSLRTLNPTIGVTRFELWEDDDAAAIYEKLETTLNLMEQEETEEE